MFLFEESRPWSLFSVAARSLKKKMVRRPNIRLDTYKRWLFILLRMGRPQSIKTSQNDKREKKRSTLKN